MKQVYHPYWLWEDWKMGMWRNVCGKKRSDYLQKAIEFTGNHQLYGFFMRKVLREWKYAAEHNLTNKSLNRKAWVGHAATCLAFNCPEDITRLAWHRLTQEQQDLANAEADKAIAEWELRYETCQSD